MNDTPQQSSKTTYTPIDPTVGWRQLYRLEDWWAVWIGAANGIEVRRSDGSIERIDHIDETDLVTITGIGEDLAGIPVTLRRNWRVPGKPMPEGGIVPSPAGTSAPHSPASRQSA